jgi:CheY-like chemotaxis protein
MSGSTKVSNGVKKVLLVDDMRAITIPMSRLLQSLGYEADSVNDSRLAMEAVRQFKPDVIFLDINMPYLDGYQVARCVRADPETERIPIIAVTTRQDDEHLRLSHEAGINSNVSKPCDVRTLAAAIDRLQLN